MINHFASLRQISWDIYFQEQFSLVQKLLHDETDAVDRTVGRANSEYSFKWSDKLAEISQNPNFKNQLLYPALGTAGMFSLGDQLFTGDLVVRHSIKDGMVNNAVARYGDGPVCVLGCGFGESLSRLQTDRPKLGGELTEEGVRCGQALGLNVRQFNYYEKADYSFIPAKSTVLSVHSIEQIPDAAPILDGLRSMRHQIQFGVHLEPTWLQSRQGLVGHLRNRYMEVNDYNRNLVSLLHDAEDIEVLEFSPDIFGQAPLNSASLIIWRFL